MLPDGLLDGLEGLEDGPAGLAGLVERFWVGDEPMLLLPVEPEDAVLPPLEAP